MSDQILTEEVLQFGENMRLLGILTLPSISQRHNSELPVLVLLNSGFLHRVGPMRLYVRLARNLAEIGFSTFRVDLTGRGDSFGRAELRNEQSLIHDYQEIVNILEARLGPSRLILGGLCSGADNALILTHADQRVMGMLLIDPTCYPDSGFKVREFFKKYTDHRRISLFLKRKLMGLNGLKEPCNNDDELYISLTSGKLPTPQQLRTAFHAILERKGRVLSVFTGGQNHYNKLGQLARILELPDYEKFCTELYYSTATHTFSLELHRFQLLNEIKTWAAGYLLS